MSLRDEHYPEGDTCHCGWKPDLVQGAQTWQQWRSHINTIIERALAAERAATIEECTRRIMDGLAKHSQVSPIFLSGIRWCADKLTTLPRDRSALDGILAQAANKFAVAKRIDEMARELATKCLQSFSLQTSEHPDATRLRDVCYTLLGTEGHNAKTFSEALSQARREQQEEDAREVAHAIEYAVEWTIRQLSQREDWTASWDAGFPSYKAAALCAYLADRRRRSAVKEE